MSARTWSRATAPRTRAQHNTQIEWPCVAIQSGCWGVRVGLQISHWVNTFAHTTCPQIYKKGHCSTCMKKLVDGGTTKQEAKERHWDTNRIVPNAHMCCGAWPCQSEGRVPWRDGGVHIACEMEWKRQKKQNGNGRGMGNRKGILTSTMPLLGLYATLRWGVTTHSYG